MPLCNNSLGDQELSRLNHMQDHELAIQTILDEIQFLELHSASDGQFDEHNVRDLGQCLQRLASIVKAVEKGMATSWETDDEPLPPWLQNRQDEDGSQTQAFKNA
jgi:hypothetical protein